MTLEEEYQKCKEENKDKYRLVHVEDKEYEYQIEYLNTRLQKWIYFYAIYYEKCGIIDLLFQRFYTYEEQAKREFIGHMRVLNKKENKTIV